MVALNRIALYPEPLTPASFAPFSDVIGMVERHPLSSQASVRAGSIDAPEKVIVPSATSPC
jgi:ureidoglycolate hydrolase